MSTFKYPLVGGRDWSNSEANKYAGEVAGKVETVRRVTNAILGTNRENIKSNQLGAWAGIENFAQQAKRNIEIRWDLYQAARSAGDIPTQKWNFQFIYEMERDAIKADKDRHIWSTKRDIDTVTQGTKTVGLAPFRAGYLIMIKTNMFNIASGLKLAQKRDIAGYNKVRDSFKAKGGNRTLFDKAVNQGYKKKPIGAKKITSTDLNFGGHLYISENAANTVQQVAVAADVATKVADATKNVDYSKGDGKTLKLPTGVGTAAALMLSAITSGTSAPIAAPAGAFLDLTTVAINGMKIPLKGGEKNSDKPSDDEVKTGIQTVSKDDVKQEWINGIPNWVTGTAGGLIIGCGVYMTVKLILKNKSKK